jgi:hypothetical protein
MAMNKGIKISLILIYIVFGVVFLFAGLNLFSPTITPYHERFLGLSHKILDPKVASLMLDLMGVGGSGFLAYAVMLLFFAIGPFRQGSLIAWKAILYSSFALLCPLLYFNNGGAL